LTNIINNSYVSFGENSLNNTNSKELVGKTCFIYNDILAVFSNHITRIRTNNKFSLPNYLSFILHFAWKQGEFLRLANKWIGQAEINTKTLSEFKIPLPPLELQKEIVAEIGGYQKIIDGARAVVDSYCPKIDIRPEWPLAKLSELCDSVSDGDHQPPPKSLSGIPFITISNITKNGDIDFSKTFESIHLNRDGSSI